MKPTDVDAAALEACSREPIHIPGAIQPHGVLLALDPHDLHCLQSSANCEDLLGLSPDQLNNRPLAATVPELARVLLDVLPSDASDWTGTFRTQLEDRPLDAAVAGDDSLILVELEPAQAEPTVHYHRALQGVFAELRAAADVEELSPLAARFVSQLTGFERVMVYRFDPDWHGEVVGEHLAAPVDSYLGHHFPAADIPEQARALYARSWLRLIPDARYTPVPIEPALNPKTGQPLNLSRSVLRSVSPVHLEYLRNMDVQASMSISLLANRQLWGLIVCHHRTPHRVSAGVRTACELFGQVASLEIEAKQEARRLAEHVRATSIQTRFFDFLAREKNFIDALVKYTPRLLQFMSATGAALHVRGQTKLLGTTPDVDQVAALLEWVREQPLEPLYETHTLPAVFPPAEAYKELASGLLAVRLSRVDPHFLLWFRPEVPTTVTWAGNPHKLLSPDQTLHPRTSFAAWRQTLTGHARGWTEVERRAALEVVQAVNAHVLRRTEKLINLNAELERKNTDLNSFAHVAAHDLKEPLRGVANYCKFIEEDHGGELSAGAREKLAVIRGLVEQADVLLDALTHFSRIGRLEINRQSVDLDELATAVLGTLASLVDREAVEIRRPKALPRVTCDPVLVREILSNLVTNAIRYNDKPRKWVELGVRPPEPPHSGPIFYVRDNGIGILERHHHNIFKIFRRLHNAQEFGGGTGAGLAIVKTLIEKHDGRIWLDSTVGEGSTFYFTLQ